MKTENLPATDPALWCRKPLHMGLSLDQIQPALAKVG